MENPTEYRLLIVNLTAETITTEILPEVVYRQYLGGRNIIVHYLLKNLPPNVDPLSPENILIFATGVTTGTPMGCMGRNSAGAKGPLTGGFAEAEAGGYFGSELKRTGYDGIVFTGKASHPVYLSISSRGAEIFNASDIWGKLIGDAHEWLISQIGDKNARTVLIGPAGENQVLTACIMNDVTHAYGRGGLGAVMGSKNIKGIVVKAYTRHEYLDDKSIKGLGRWFNQTWKTVPSAEFWAKHGTIGFLSALNAAGSLPTRNFQEGIFEGAEEITGEVLTERYLVGRGSCYACSVRCKREVELSEPFNVSKSYGGPEYETAAAFGSDIGVSNLEVIVKSNQLCNAFGLDTISVGATIAWAMECYEKGLISKEQCDGLELNFGNAEILIPLIEKIAYKEGIGKILGNGAARAAKILGVGSEYAMHVKGLDFPMHEPRVKHGLGLSYAVSPTGADHLVAIHDVAYTNALASGFSRLRELGILEALSPTTLSPAKVRMAVYEITLNSLYNCLVMCNSARQPFRFDLDRISEAIRAITGWKMSSWELMKVAERGITMTRIFNLREGFTAQDDDLPTRMFEKLHPSVERSAIDKQEFSKAISLYYEMMGWDGIIGVPTQGKLVELGIGWAYDQLPKQMPATK